MDKPKLTKEQQEYLDEQLARGGAFEQMMTTDGWKYIKAYIENKIRTFSNKAIIEGFKTMEEYKEEKGEVNGLRELLQHMDGAIQTAYAEKKKNEADK